ncbi:MAG: Fic family protein [Lachnospiraceae bacterium]|nr:Fic family protein [Lachnospiraceae bacterium]
MSRLTDITEEYKRLGIPDQIDYKKLYLYSIITHSTAVEGSTVSEVENRLMFDDGISPNKPLVEQLMNLDLKNAYVEALALAEQHTDYSVRLLCHLAAMVMNNTGAEYDTLQGKFSSAKGELRRLNVTAGRGGKSYMSYQKVPQRLEDFCNWLNTQRKNISPEDVDTVYELSFMAHYNLVYIHPWADGNGRMSRLVMNMIQAEFGVVPSIVRKESREAYIKSIAASQEAGDSAEFMKIMMDHHIDSLERSIEEYKASIENDTLNLENDTLNDTLNASSNLSEKESRILELIKSDTNITIGDIVEKTGYSRPTVTRAIQTLKECGLLGRIGAKKDGHWDVKTK